MTTTRYFDEQVLRKRPYVSVELCLKVIVAPTTRLVQPDGRIRHWAEVLDTRDGKSRMLRVVTLSDGQTIHNAFFDRGFSRRAP